MKYYVGIDLGGTNIVAGIVDENYNIIAKEKNKTMAVNGVDYVVSTMIETTKQAIEKANLTIDDIEWIGVGTPGIANPDTQVVEFSPNLHWHNVPLGDMIGAGLNKKVYIANDANAAAYGEFIAGSGKDVNSLIAITLGTGVGGGVITNGKILTGSNNAGAELGHTVIVAKGRQCGCGRKGCFEAYSSATGLINLTKDAMKENKDTVMWELCEGDTQNVGGKTAFDGMRAGDSVATQVVDDFIGYLAIGVTNMINIFQPEVLCIGGGICKEGDTLIKPLTKLVREHDFVKDPDKCTKIVVAELGNDAGVIGAAMLGLERQQ